MRHQVLIRRLNAWPRDSPSRPIDTVQLFLGYLALALDTDGGVQLEDAAAVAEVRAGFVGLLARYLKHRWGSVNSSC